MSEPLTGYLTLQGWAGVHKTLAEIVGKTPKRFRIRAITETKLAGRYRWLSPGKEILVPCYAVRDHCSKCGGAKGGVPGNENRDARGNLLCDYCWEAES